MSDDEIIDLIDVFDGPAPIERSMVQTTCPRAAAGKGRSSWLTLRQSRKLDDDSVYVFSDGSSLGSYAAVIVRRGAEPIVLGVAGPAVESKNIGPELGGALLGLQNVPEGSQVVLVCDLLNVPAWMTRNYKRNAVEVIEVCAEMERVIAEKKLAVTYCHHRGHQKPSDDDEFSKWNRLADKTCTKLATEAKKNGEP